MPHQPGEIYLRPCVSSYGQWWPILDINPHIDPEIDETRLHVHVDERFLSDKVLASRKSAPEASPFLITCTKDVELFAYRKVRCYRTHAPKIPLLQQIDLEELEKSCRNLRMGSDLICPHQGAPLADAPIVSGCLQCPAHGMHWSQVTGKLTPLYTQTKHRFEREKVGLEAAIDAQIHQLKTLLNQ
ncbi:MAG: Rieske 2Fe-2S domain-containing protein [Cyanobacteria bacterium P01_A01_bin.137]